MECVICKYDPDVPVTGTWLVRLPGVALPSTNSLGSNTRRYNKYRSFRTKFSRLLDKYATEVPPAEAKRRVLIVRQYGKRKRAYDYGNLVGGCKPLLDCLKEHSLILDDSPKQLADYYLQERSPDGTDNVTIVIEDGEF